MSDTSGRPSTPSLMAEAMSQMTRLFETEIRLVRTELGEKLGEAVKALAVIVFSAVLLLVALVILLEGVVYLLIYFGLIPFVAYFIVGAASIIIGGLAVYFALKQLRPAELTPKRSINQLTKDARVIKEQVS